MKFTLCEKYLTEDRTVKFGGESFPKFGWCVIMCGGPGSGKSAVYDNIVSIDAKKYDVDEVKKLFDSGKIINTQNRTISPRHNRDISLSMYDVDGGASKYDLNNPAYVNRLHYATKPWTRAKKANTMNQGQFAEDGRLPNIAFDMVGDNIDDIYEIVESVKRYGYKVAVVFVCNDVDIAYKQNKQRARRVKDSIFYPKHKGVYDTILNIAQDSRLLRMIDNFWVVIQKDYGNFGHVKNGVRNTIDSSGRIISTNRWSEDDPFVKFSSDSEHAYLIKSAQDVLMLPEIVVSMISKNMDTLQTAYSNKDSWDKDI